MEDAVKKIKKVAKHGDLVHDGKKNKKKIKKAEKNAKKALKKLRK